MSAPHYVVCPVCQGDHFLLSRRLYLLTLDDGVRQRNWASSENSSNEVACATCSSRLRWNVETQNYIVFHTREVST